MNASEINSVATRRHVSPQNRKLVSSPNQFAIDLVCRITAWTIAFLFMMGCATASANTQIGLSIYDYGYNRTNLLVSLVRQNTQLFTFNPTVRNDAEFYNWIHYGSDSYASAMLLGVSSHGVSKMFGKFNADPNRFSIHKLGTMYGIEGKNLLVLAPDNYRVMLPAIYAVHKLGGVDPSDAWFETKSLFDSGDDTRAALKMLTAIPDIQSQWPMKTMIVRYPNSSDDDDDCGCDSQFSPWMTCDPDGMSNAFDQIGHVSGYIGPTVNSIDGGEGYDFGALSDDCPVCEYPRWRTIRSPNKAVHSVLTTIGSPDDRSYGPEERSKISAILSEVHRFPFDSSVITIMSCDPD